MEFSKLHGLGLKRPTVRLADLMQTGLPDKHAQVLLDFGAFNWAAMGHGIKPFEAPEPEFRQFATRVLSEYKRTSRTSILAFVKPVEGRLAIQRGNRELQTLQGIAQTLGGKVEMVPVQNKYLITTPELSIPLKHHHDYSASIVIHWPE
jgi:hypothetical protein